MALNHTFSISFAILLITTAKANHKMHFKIKESFYITIVIIYYCSLQLDNSDLDFLGPFRNTLSLFKINSHEQK
jgi:hypothetical protein